MNKSIILIATLTLTGCATPIYYKQGVPTAQFEQDKAECAQEAANINAGLGLGFNPIFIVQHSQGCLERKGWVKQ